MSLWENIIKHGLNLNKKEKMNRYDKVSGIYTGLKQGRNIFDYFFSKFKVYLNFVVLICR